ncbi:MAG: hybrid sensor histidine kinase/response regulator [Myxococcales bacterium]
MVQHTYAQLPTSLVFNAGGAATFVIACYAADHGWRMWLWCIAHLVASMFQLMICWRAPRDGWLAGDGRKAQLARRIGTILVGSAWGLGGVLWSMTPGAGTGQVLIFCYAGIVAGATSTLSGDPVCYALLVYLTLLPSAVRGWTEGLWWSSALLIWFAVGTTLVVVRNAKALRESLNLRFENVELLQQTLASHEAAVEARSHAERTAEIKTRFLAAASHDLRQPVQALAMFNDVLGGLRDDQAEPRRRLVDAIGRSTNALRAMLEGLLDVSRLDAGLTRSTPRAVPLEPLLTEVVAGLRDECDALDVLLYVRGRPATVLADPTLLARVLHNLAANAVRHGGRGRVLIALRMHGPACTIQFWDQGPGIAEEDRERIFDDFVQVGNRERDRSKGLGLGLPIVQRICALNDWRLDMRTRIGHGSMFSVSVPRAASEADSVVLPKLPTSLCLQVMLVEDDPLVSHATRTWLEAQGCVVHTAINGSDALVVLARMNEEGTPADVLVTDHRLPGDLSGAELIGVASSNRTRRLHSVLLTGDADVSTGGKLSPNLVVLRKPVSGEVLWQAVLGC